MPHLLRSWLDVARLRADAVRRLPRRAGQGAERPFVLCGGANPLTLGACVVRRASDAQLRQLARAREKRSELDDAVTVNLAPDEIALWRKVRGMFKGPPHARFEAFRRYVEEHPGEVERAIAEACEDSFDFGANVSDRAPKKLAKRRKVPGEDEVIDLDDAPIVVWGDVAYIAA